MMQSIPNKVIPRPKRVLFVYWLSDRHLKPFNGSFQFVGSVVQFLFHQAASQPLNALRYCAGKRQEVE